MSKRGMPEELPAGAGGRENMLVAMSSKGLSEALSVTRKLAAPVSQTDLWATPQWLYDKLDLEFNFTVDVCATPETPNASGFIPRAKTVLCRRGPEQAGLTLPMEKQSACGSLKRGRRRSCRQKAYRKRYP